MKIATHTRVQIAVAAISFASLVGFAGTMPDMDETQSFIGTTPAAETVEAQPATF